MSTQCAASVGGEELPELDREVPGVWRADHLAGGQIQSRVLARGSVVLVGDEFRRGAPISLMLGLEDRAYRGIPSSVVR